ncbi:type VI secretion protein [Budviciaceae bacterium CWB-B4]|uniref:Type VI secretion protein n=2 Tax=Limnobaculum xujianqingii TaxID=2738837 RepID=A0A9D7FQG6_9GAMM|nr:type VI secretion protein [Limnobaculum xujianqingii]MBK5174919.1 type VI secretion protein [Limnobaculum xujianqingii]
MSVTQPLPQNTRLDNRELTVSSMLPYTYHYDDDTLMTSEHALVQVIKLDGLYYESLSSEQIANFERQRNTILRSISSPDRMLYAHLVRRRVDRYPAGVSDNWFARLVDQHWRNHCQQQPFFINELYISIVRQRFRIGVPGLFDRLAGSFGGNTREHIEDWVEQAEDVYEASNLLLKTLSRYGARRLSVVSQHGERYSEIGQFLHYLVNLEDTPCPLSEQSLSTTLAASRLHFGGQVMEVEGISQRRAGAMLSMAEWPKNTRSPMLNAFLRLPVEFVLSQSFQFVDQISSEEQMRRQGRRASHSDSDDNAEIAASLKALGSGSAVNGLHHLTLFTHVPVTDSVAQTQADLNAAVDEVKRAFVGLNVRPVREYFALETFFWSQLPGQATHLIGRRGRINSKNFAGFVSLHNHAAGRLSGNLWGPAIIALPTISGTLYSFNFHRESDGMVAGHTAITADTGAGKTALLCMLTAMADKVRPRVYWFDNRRGAEVFIRAMGGRHLTLSVHGNSGWNPFALPDTPENRAYLIDLQVLMRSCYAGAPSADDIERFKRAVEENYQLPQQDRRLRNVAWCYGHNELAKVMQVWYGEGANAGAFDNEADSFDLSVCRHYGFEMQELIKDGEARPELAVILSYPFHRIEQAMNGEPFMLVLEEGQNLVRHDYWKTRIDVYLMQIRRKNGIVIFVTPDAKYLYCETDAIEKQTVTKLFLPNPNAKARDYIEALGLTQEEYEFIRDTPPEARQFLIRRGNESVRAVFDLSHDGLRDLIPLLSSNDKGVALMHEIIAELNTDDPACWVPVFIERAKARNTHNLSKGT